MGGGTSSAEPQGDRGKGRENVLRGQRGTGDMEKPSPLKDTKSSHPLSKTVGSVLRPEGHCGTTAEVELLYEPVRTRNGGSAGS